MVDLAVLLMATVIQTKLRDWGRGPMPEVKVVRCYLAVHNVSPGLRWARLREKQTGRCISIEFNRAAERQGFVQFLSGVERYWPLGRREQPEARQLRRARGDPPVGERERS